MLEPLLQLLNINVLGSSKNLEHTLRVKVFCASYKQENSLESDKLSKNRSF